METTRINECQKRLLVVEDDPTLYKFWQRISDQLPCISKVVKTPREAIEWLKTSEADVLLTDLRLPEMNGVDLIKKIQRGNPQLKTIVTSSHFEDTGPLSDLDQFVHMIEKPYLNLENLLCFITQCLADGNEMREVEAKDKTDGMHIWRL